MQQLTYSVLYHDSLERPCSVDWRPGAGQWSRWMGDTLGWDHIGDGLDAESYKALLAHFGLEEVADEHPISAITSQRPQDLARKRRELEARKGLDRLEMRSHTVGYDGEADFHEG